MFYRFVQNNAHGHYLLPAYMIFVEADTKEEAWKVCQDVPGVYYDPQLIFDCRCCGTRWYSHGNEPGFTFKWLYDWFYSHWRFGYPPQWNLPDVPLAHIQYKNGRVITIKEKSDLEIWRKYQDKLENDMFPEI
jgi:hypothetical protein